MFSDGSINIHYRAPASKLLKMNTLNEFEVNRLRKLYGGGGGGGGGGEEGGALGGVDCGCPHLHYPPARGLQRSKSSRLSTAEPCSGHHFRRRQLQTERPLEPSSPYVDLQRYQRALLNKSSAPPSSRRQAGAWTRPLSSSQRFGRALFDFQARNGQELSLGQGDLVELLEVLVDEPQWAHVEDCQSGLQGLVPMSYVDFSVGCALAKRDVSGSSRNSHLHRTAALGHPAGGPHQELLPMSKGEPITLLRRHQGHWYEASNTRKHRGLVWSNDLEIIKQPLVSSPEHQRQASSAANTAKPRPRSAGPTCRLARMRSSSAASRFSDADEDDEEEDDDEERDVEMRARDEEEEEEEPEAQEEPEEEEDEEEMYILESGERLFARRSQRPLSPSHNQACLGPSCCLQQQQHHQLP